MKTLAYFDAIGTETARRWSRYEFDAAALPEIATDVLSTSRPHDNIDSAGIIQWLTTTDSLPPQTDLEASFGEPPVTLFWHPRFYIEALYWVNATTSIHQHGFSGAFAVLEGASIQTRYDYKTHRRVNAHVLLGELSVREVILLRPGDAQPIIGGSALIHSVFHLNAPSVTIVIRTPGDVDSLPQYRYLRPYLAFNPQYKDPVGVRRLQMLRSLSTLGLESFEKAASRAILNSDFLTTFYVLSHARTVLGQARFENLLDAAVQRYGPDTTRIRAVIEEDYRQTTLTRKRNVVKDVNLRFFIALLLNIQGRESMLKLVADEYPDEDPLVIVTECAFGAWSHLVKTELTPLRRRIVAMLFEGLALDEISERVGAGYGGAVLCRDLEREYDHLRQHLSSFRPVLPALWATTAEPPRAIDYR